MNTITRETIERELADIEECHARTVDQVEHFRGQLKEAEAARDKYANQIGALKEDLGSAGAGIVSHRIRQAMSRAFD